MIFLSVLVGLGHAALMTDFANVYYCGADQCLNSYKPNFRAGPAASFRGCYDGEGNYVGKVKTWNSYVDTENEYDSENMWSLFENHADVPKSHPDDESFKMAPCCEGYKAEQCTLMDRMKPIEEEEGCCYSYGLAMEGNEMVQVSHTPHDGKDMTEFSKCPVVLPKGFVGGSVGFEVGVSCKDHEKNEWKQTPKKCCRGLTATCLACTYGVKPETYCKAYPETPGCQEDHKICCRAMTASCLSCSYDMTEKEVCAKYPGLSGCEGNVCCKAMTSTCLACQQNISVEEYCRDNPEQHDCPKQRACCKALTAECQACANNVSVDQYCAKFPWTQGCDTEKPEMCCRAMTAKCLACTERVSVSEYCTKNPEIMGCKVCCEADSPTCNGCRTDQTPEEWCEDNPFRADCYAKRGETCGSCYCPPTFMSKFPNKCDSNHECTKNKMIPDLPGKCEPVYRKVGESCGSCYCPPTYDAGECEKGLRCVHNPMIMDAPGKCVEGMCCKAMTAKCLACNAGVTEKEYCDKNPGTTGCKNQMCCKAMTAQCMACEANMTVEMFCKLNKFVTGCEDDLKDEDEDCGYFFGPKDNNDAGKCKDGLRCVYNPFIADAPGRCMPGGNCCKAMTATCLACQKGVKKEEYCKENPKTVGCPEGKACCKAFTPECMACSYDMTVEEFCKFDMEFPGCGGCSKDSDCENNKLGPCAEASCVEGKCMISMEDCMPPPRCKDGSRPKKLKGSCCEYEECPKAKKCKKDKSCTKLGSSPCEEWICNKDTKTCELGAEIMCDAPPPCPGDKPREFIPKSCCGFYPCDWDGDKCNAPGAVKKKGKKDCKAFGKQIKASCAYYKIKDVEKCWTPTKEACKKFNKKECKKAGCKYKNDVCQ